MGAAALALTELALPFVFAIDANEPAAETIATVRFHWHDGGPAQRSSPRCLDSRRCTELETSGASGSSRPAARGGT